MAQQTVAELWSSIMGAAPGIIPANSGTIALAERLIGDCLEPGLRILGFQRALLGWRVERTGAAGALDVGELAVHPVIDAGDLAFYISQSVFAVATECLCNSQPDGVASYRDAGVRPRRQRFRPAAGSPPAAACPLTLFASIRALSIDREAGFPNEIVLLGHRLPVNGSVSRGR